MLQLNRKQIQHMHMRSIAYLSLFMVVAICEIPIINKLTVPVHQEFTLNQPGGMHSLRHFVERPQEVSCTVKQGEGGMQMEQYWELHQFTGESTEDWQTQITSTAINSKDKTMYALLSNGTLIIFNKIIKQTSISLLQQKQRYQPSDESQWFQMSLRIANDKLFAVNDGVLGRIQLKDKQWSWYQIQNVGKVLQTGVGSFANEQALIVLELNQIVKIVISTQNNQQILSRSILYTTKSNLVSMTILQKSILVLSHPEGILHLKYDKATSTQNAPKSYAIQQIYRSHLIRSFSNAPNDITVWIVYRRGDRNGVIEYRLNDDVLYQERVVGAFRSVKDVVMSKDYGIIYSSFIYSIHPHSMHIADLKLQYSPHIPHATFKYTKIQQILPVMISEFPKNKPLFLIILQGKIHLMQWSGDLWAKKMACSSAESGDMNIQIKWQGVCQRNTILQSCEYTTLSMVTVLEASHGLAPFDFVLLLIWVILCSAVFIGLKIFRKHVSQQQQMKKKLRQQGSYKQNGNVSQVGTNEMISAVNVN